MANSVTEYMAISVNHWVREHYSMMFGRSLTTSKNTVNSCCYVWRVVMVHLDVVHGTR